jgi:hypothetical protein
MIVKNSLEIGRTVLPGSGSSLGSPCLRAFFFRVICGSPSALRDQTSSSFGPPWKLRFHCSALAASNSTLKIHNSEFGAPAFRLPCLPLPAFATSVLVRESLIGGPDSRRRWERNRISTAGVRNASVASSCSSCSSCALWFNLPLLPMQFEIRKQRSKIRNDLNAQLDLPTTYH